MQNLTPFPLDASGERAASLRLERQYLGRRAEPSKLSEVVAAVCGLQAQLPVAAELAARSRVANLTRRDVETALWERRTIVRTWAMRGTLHVLASQDLTLVAAALGNSSLAREQAYLERRRSLSAAELVEATEAILGALDGRCLTRKQLTDALGANVQPKIRDLVMHGYGELIKPAAQQGLICFGPNNGSESTFVRVDQWIRAPQSAPDEKTARRELACRYLSAYGPATPQDFGGWAGIPVRLAKETWNGLEPHISEVEVGGRRMWALHDDVERLTVSEEKAAPVCLLPSFDPLLLAYRDKQQLVATEEQKHVFRKAGWIAPTVLVGGRVAGVWRHERRGRKVIEVTVHPFRPLSSAAREGIWAEAEDVARFLGGESRLTISQRPLSE